MTTERTATTPLKEKHYLKESIFHSNSARHQNICRTASQKANQSPQRGDTHPTTRVLRAAGRGNHLSKEPGKGKTICFLPTCTYTTAGFCRSHLLTCTLTPPGPEGARLNTTFPPLPPPGPHSGRGGGTRSGSEEAARPAPPRRPREEAQSRGGGRPPPGVGGRDLPSLPRPSQQVAAPHPPSQRRPRPSPGPEAALPRSLRPPPAAGPSAAARPERRGKGSPAGRAARTPSLTHPGRSPQGRPRRLPCRAARGGGGHGRGGGGRVEEARREGGGQGGRGPPSPPSLPPLGPLSRLRGAPSGRRLGLKAQAPPADAAPARTPAQRSPPPPPQRYVAARSQSRDSAARTRGHAPRRWLPRARAGGRHP